MNNRMLRTRGRKRHARSTRKKCINCTEWKERRPCKRSTRRKRTAKHKKRIMRGGRSDAPTIETKEGIAVTRGTDVTIDGGQGSYDLDAFQKHLEYRDQQGKGGTPGYDD